MEEIFSQIWDVLSLVFGGIARGIERGITSLFGSSNARYLKKLQPTIDAATRTLRVRFDVKNSDGALKPGMYATVTLEKPLGEVLALPEEAVIDTGRRKLVFVEVAEGRFQPREVSLGRKGQAHYEVLSGLAEGERVVVSAQFLLDSESRLRGAAGPAHGAH